MVAQATKSVSLSQEEYDELIKLKETQASRKSTSQARSKARAELIKKHKTEYDALIKQYGGSTS